MVSQRTEAAHGSETWAPVPEDELAAIVDDELVARVRKLQQEPSAATSHEEFVQELGMEDLLERE